MTSLAELVTQSFYAWEIRGRGWQLADYIVCLEPPFRPFFLLPGTVHPPARIDDGRRDTILSSLVAGAKRILSGSPRPKVEDTPFEEQEPYPGEEAPSLFTLRLSVPADFSSDLERARQLLVGLGPTIFPVSFEFIGSGGTVVLQLCGSTLDEEHVRSTIAGIFSEAVATAHEDALWSAWELDRERAIIDFGLSQEFFLPVASFRSFGADPYAQLVAALARAGPGECACFQIVFEHVRNPWAHSITDALRDWDGECIFADAPEFPSFAKEKTDSPLFAVVLRVAAQARGSERAWELARGVARFLLQFSRPGSNEFVPLSNDEYPDDPHEAALVTRTSYRTGMLLSARELTGLVHLPDRSVRHPAFVREGLRSRAAPEGSSGHPLVLGVNEHHSAQVLVGLSTEERLQHTHVIGVSGTGKSTLLLNLIVQDIEQGRGVAVIDPHGDLIDDVLARVPERRSADVVLFDPADEDWPVGLNILSAKTEVERLLLSSDLVGIFQRFATSWGDTMSTVLGNAVLAMLSGDQPATLVDLRRFLLDERFRKNLLTHVGDEEVRLFWEKQYPLIGARSVGPILARLDTFLRPRLIRNIVGQPEGKLDLGAILRDGKILLAKLAHGLIGEENAYLLGSLLVAKLHQLALARQREAVSARNPFFVSIDEVQHFVTPSMCSLLSGARKYGLGLTLAHQTLSQLASSHELEGALLGNAYTRIVFRVGDSDAKKLAEGFSFFDAKDLTGLSRGRAVVRIGGSANDCNIETFPAKRLEGDADTRIARIVAASRERYAVSREVVEKTLSAARALSVAVPTPEETPTSSSIAATPSKQEPTASPVEKEVAMPAPAPKRTRRQTEPIEVPPLGRGGQEHKYLQHLIKRLAEERGYRATIEEDAGDGKADVVLRKGVLTVACEISITTDVEHEIGNLKKCQQGGFSRILFVSPDRKRQEKVAKRLKELDTSIPIDVVGPDELVAALDAFEPTPTASESTVRGYKVKVSRQSLSPDEVAGRRSAIAEVIARSMKKH